MHPYRSISQTLTSSAGPTTINDRDPFHDAIASPEHLNAVTFAGIPPHKLVIKHSVMVMITRKLTFSEGIVNGKKAQVIDISSASRVLQVGLLDGSDSSVFIPRMPFNVRVGRVSISFTRTQLILCLAYACTINKSQGQILWKIGLDLRSKVFSHGQLCVGLSRAQGRHAAAVHCLFPSSSRIHGKIGFATNVICAPLVSAATGHPPPSYNSLRPIPTAQLLRRWPSHGAILTFPSSPSSSSTINSAVQKTKTNSPPTTTPDHGVEETKRFVPSIRCYPSSHHRLYISIPRSPSLCHLPHLFLTIDRRSFFAISTTFLALSTGCLHLHFLTCYSSSTSTVADSSSLSHGCSVVAFSPVIC